MLLSIGGLDPAWAPGDRTIPIGLGGLWIAAFWALRAVSQFAVGRRGVDVSLVLLFAAASVVHIVIALRA